MTRGANIHAHRMLLISLSRMKIYEGHADMGNRGFLFFHSTHVDKKRSSFLN